MYTCVFSLPVGPSVTKLVATVNTPNMTSNLYDYTVICTIHPDSTANKCEVMAKGGRMMIKGMFV